MKPELKIFNDLIDTIVKNSIDNTATITNVELWAKDWKEEMQMEIDNKKIKKSKRISFNPRLPNGGLLKK